MRWLLNVLRPKLWDAPKFPRNPPPKPIAEASSATGNTSNIAASAIAAGTWRRLERWRIVGRRFWVRLMVASETRDGSCIQAAAMTVPSPQDPSTCGVGRRLPGSRLFLRRDEFHDL